MRAAVFEGVERIVVQDWPDPRIGADEVLVRAVMGITGGRGADGFRMTEGKKCRRGIITV